MNPLDFNNNVYTDQTLLPSSVNVKFINVEYYFNKVYLFLNRMFGGDSIGVGQVLTNEGGDVAGAVRKEMAFNSLDLFAGFMTDLLYFVLILLITVIAYVIVRMLELRKKEHEHIHHEIHEFAHKHHEVEKKKAEAEMGRNGKPKNERWENILKHLYSESSADWKLSIIDADEMLLTLMTDMGFKGEGLGEKLKSADRDEFHSLSAAWEVHTVRNRIAHEGLSYELSQREAKRVIALYEQIFHEFGYV
ncbi:MAG: hypothetical protein NTW98_02705 [Candidatus Nomurabacteria bacterium]|nr:hypothetical protein [Candidatus Nomurabacteria bacterium]